jgi:hypothetical protein
VVQYAPSFDFFLFLETCDQSFPFRYVTCNSSKVCFTEEDSMTHRRRQQEVVVSCLYELYKCLRGVNNTLTCIRLIVNCRPVLWYCWQTGSHHLFTAAWVCNNVDALFVICEQKLILCRTAGLVKCQFLPSVFALFHCCQDHDCCEEGRNMCYHYEYIIIPADKKNRKSMEMVILGPQAVVQWGKT